MAAANPGPVPSAVLVLEDLLKKYKFVLTCAASESESFAWPEKDEHFRYLPIECTGFAENNGTVYVNGEILSLLSDEFKQNIDREQQIRIDCTAERFDTVMTFVHSANRKRPTNDELLKLLPMLHDCKLQLLSDICADHLNLGNTPKADLLALALRLESNVLLDRLLLKIRDREEMRALLEACNVCRDARSTAFGGHACGKILELAIILPSGQTPPTFRASNLLSGAKTEIEKRLTDLSNAMDIRCRDGLPNFAFATRFRDFPLTIDDDKAFVSREFLAHASRYFHQIFYGDFVEGGSARFEVDNASFRVLKLFLAFLYPTPFGMLWRLTPQASLFEINHRRRILGQTYNNGFCFYSDPEKFVSVFKLAQYYQATGLVDYLTDVAVYCLPWRQRLELADLFKSHEIMASLLSDDSLKELKNEMDASDTALDNLSSQTKDLIIDFLLKTRKL